MLLYVVALLEISDRSCAVCALEQHDEIMSGGAERRNEVLNYGTHGVALPAWHAKTPSLGACNQHSKLVRGSLPVASAPACSSSLQLGVAKSTAMGASQSLLECLCMDLNPQQYLKKPDLKSLQAIKGQSKTQALVAHSIWIC